MSFLGNLNGPKESEITEKLGPNYFGITWEQLERDVADHVDAENRKEVVPVRIDSTGEPYIRFSSPDKKGQRFYLIKEGYQLHGKVLCINEKGKKLIMKFD
jgi:hypothetical protein